MLYFRHIVVEQRCGWKISFYSHRLGPLLPLYVILGADVVTLSATLAPLPYPDVPDNVVSGNRWRHTIARFIVRHLCALFAVFFFCFVVLFYTSVFKLSFVGRGSGVCNKTVINIARTIQQVRFRVLSPLRYRRCISDIKKKKVDFRVFSITYPPILLSNLVTTRIGA